MRLVAVDTYQVRVFDKNDTPPYAILSHVWGDDEVTFHDLQNPETAADKAGFWKLEQFCAEAGRNGLSYVWTDTCCIDRTSSAELEQPIDSMFRWHSEAKECYAHLDDLKVFDGRDTFDGARGWTLQELIASREVVFFDKDWQHFGRK